MSGRVYLVGAGPGEPGLITARGLELLRTADVVLYDRLVARALIEEARPDAEVVFVGKKPGEVHSRQIVADALMIDRAAAGKRVVRLKGGDPFVFGRGGEELSMLAEAGVPFEVVPGVTSAVAAPAFAGIPVTHRGLASSFAVVAAADQSEDRIRWDEIARGPDTVVLLMGVRSLRSVAEHLISGGRDPAQPAAVVEWGTLASQRVVVGQLGGIAEQAEKAGIKAPATTVIGDVVGLRKALEWFELRPLHGLRVVVTRAPHQAGDLAERLAEAGASVIHMPAIDIEEPDSFDEIDYAAKKLAEGLYSWVVFNSANGVDRFCERVFECGFDARAFGRTKIAAVGAVTARSLERFGLRPDFVPDKFTGEFLAETIGRGAGRVLIPRVEDAPQDMLEVLRKSGWTPEECVVYKNVLGPRDTPAVEAVRAGEFDIVTFASASAVRGFAEIVGPPEEVGLAGGYEEVSLVACIGPATAAEARALGFRVDVVAEEHTAPGLVSALVEHLGRGSQ